MEPKQENPIITWIILLIIIMTLVVGIGYLYLKSQDSAILQQLFPADVPISQPTSAPSIAQVSITEKGFIPATISVKKGTKITWINQDSQPHQVASDPYPTQANFPDLKSPLLPLNASYDFVFDKAGTFTYQDYLNPLKFKGTIIVNE